MSPRNSLMVARTRYPRTAQPGQEVLVEFDVESGYDVAVPARLAVSLGDQPRALELTPRHGDLEIEPLGVVTATATFAMPPGDAILRAELWRTGDHPALEDYLTLRVEPQAGIARQIAGSVPWDVGMARNLQVAYGQVEELP